MPEYEQLKNDMEQTFLICSLPRSRTLWFSEFLSVPGQSVCTHEACEHAASAKEFWGNAQGFCAEAGANIYGNADSANLFVLPALLAERPLTRVIWIDRPKEEVMASMKANAIPHDFKSVDMMIRLAAVYRECFDMIVSFDSLQHYNVIRMVWQVLMPGVAFNAGRWGQYANRRIAYGVGNPFPKRDYMKFFQWVQKELAEPVWREW